VQCGKRFPAKEYIVGQLSKVTSTSHFSYSAVIGCSEVCTRRDIVQYELGCSLLNNLMLLKLTRILGRRALRRNAERFPPSAAKCWYSVPPKLEDAAGILYQPTYLLIHDTFPCWTMLYDCSIRNSSRPAEAPVQPRNDTFDSCTTIF